MQEVANKMLFESNGFKFWNIRKFKSNRLLCYIKYTSISSQDYRGE